MKIKTIIPFLATLILLTGFNQLSAQTDVEMREYKLKSAFIFRFIDYFDWENNPKVVSDSETFNIAILGKRDRKSTRLNSSHG